MQQPLRTAAKSSTKLYGQHSYSVITQRQKIGVELFAGGVRLPIGETSHKKLKIYGMKMCITKMPSNLAATKARPGSLVASAKVCCCTSRLPNVKMSLLRKPDKDPLPY